MATDIFSLSMNLRLLKLKSASTTNVPRHSFCTIGLWQQKKQVYDEWKDILQLKILHRSWDPRHRQQAIDIPLGAEDVCTLRGKAVSMDKGYGTTRGEMYENTPDKLFLYGNLHVGEYKGFIKCFFFVQCNNNGEICHCKLLCNWVINCNWRGTLHQNRKCRANKFRILLRHSASSVQDCEGNGGNIVIKKRATAYSLCPGSGSG